MAAPTNLSAATAIDLGPRPALVTQNVKDAGTNYTVWYKATAAPTDRVWSIFGHGPTAISGYLVLTAIFVGPASAPVPYLDISQFGPNLCHYIPVTPGETYYFKFVANQTAAAADLTVSLLSHADIDTPAGTICVNDDDNRYPLALIDSNTPTLTVLRYVLDQAAGETAECLDDGTFAITEYDPNTGFASVRIYDALYRLVVANIGGITDAKRISSDRNATFYVSRDEATAGHRITAFTKTGVVLRTWTVTSGLMFVLAIAPDASIAYYFDGTSPNTVISRWDLVNDVALTPLVTVVGKPTRDAYCLADGGLVILLPGGPTLNGSLLIYNPDGTLRRTIAVPPRTEYGDRLARGQTDATVWVWKKILRAGAIQVFQEFRVSDGAVLRTVNNGVLFGSGKYQGDVTLTPLTRFGNSNSCPFWITRQPFPVQTGTIRIEKVVDLPGDTTTFFFEATGFAPATFVLRHGESFVVDVPAGGTYAVREVPRPGWAVEAEVSNGTLDHIIVVADEETTVVFTNTPTLFGPGFVLTEHLIRRVRQAPHISAENVRFQYHEFQLDTQVGIGLPIESGIGKDPVIYLQWSDTNSETWSNEYPMLLWRLGQYFEQVVWRRLGQSRDRIFRVIVSEPVDVALIEASLKLSKGLS